MGIGVEDGLRIAREDLYFLEELKKKYPDAHLEKMPDGRQEWLSFEALKDITGLHAIINDYGEPYLCPYTMVYGRRVFAGKAEFHEYDFAYYANTHLTKLSKDLVKQIIEAFMR